MAEKHNLRKSMAEAFDIPDDVAFGSARITITGDSALTAENHKGIIEYLPGKIVFRTAEGQAEVLGEQLALAELKTDTLSITGAIMAVCLVREEESHGRR